MSVIDKFYSKNKNLRDGSLKILGEYVNSSTKILCEDRFGKLLIDPKSILRGCSSSIQSARKKLKGSIDILERIAEKYDWGRAKICK